MPNKAERYKYRHRRNSEKRIFVPIAFDFIGHHPNNNCPQISNNTKLPYYSFRVYQTNESKAWKKAKQMASRQICRSCGDPFDYNLTIVERLGNWV